METSWTQTCRLARVFLINWELGSHAFHPAVGYSYDSRGELLLNFSHSFHPAVGYSYDSRGESLLIGVGMEMSWTQTLELADFKGFSY